MAAHEDKNARKSRPYVISRGMLAMASIVRRRMTNRTGCALMCRVICGT